MQPWYDWYGRNKRKKPTKEDLTQPNTEQLNNVSEEEITTDQNQMGYGDEIRIEHQEENKAPLDLKLFRRWAKTGQGLTAGQQQLYMRGYRREIGRELESGQEQLTGLLAARGLIGSGIEVQGSLQLSQTAMNLTSNAYQKLQEFSMKMGLQRQQMAAQNLMKYRMWKKENRQNWKKWQRQFDWEKNKFLMEYQLSYDQLKAGTKAAIWGAIGSVLGSAAGSYGGGG